MNEDLKETEKQVTKELYELIREAQGCETLEGLQPPRSVVMAMAKAAAQVLMAFERGYQMG